MGGNHRMHNRRLPAILAVVCLMLVTSKSYPRKRPVPPRRRPVIKKRPPRPSPAVVIQNVTPSAHKICLHDKAASFLAKEALAVAYGLLAENPTVVWKNPPVFSHTCSAHDISDGEIVHFIAGPYATIVSGMLHRAHGSDGAQDQMRKEQLDALVPPTGCPQAEAVSQCSVLPGPDFVIVRNDTGDPRLSCPALGAEEIKDWCEALSPIGRDETYGAYLKRLLVSDTEMAIKAETLRFLVYDMTMWDETLNTKTLSNPHVSYYCLDQHFASSFVNSMRTLFEHLEYPRQLLYDLLDKLKKLDIAKDGVHARHFIYNSQPHGKKVMELEAMVVGVDHAYYGGHLWELELRVDAACGVLQPPEIDAKESEMDSLKD